MTSAILSFVATPRLPCSAAVGCPWVCRRTSWSDVAFPSVSRRMASVGGCCPEDDGACVRVVPGLKVGPEPASAADKLFVTVSISVVQGPALAELGIHDNSAKLASMRIGWFITSTFRQVARRKRWFRRAVPGALLARCASCTDLLNRGWSLNGNQLGPALS